MIFGIYLLFLASHAKLTSLKVRFHMLRLRNATDVIKKKKQCKINKLRYFFSCMCFFSCIKVKFNELTLRESPLPNVWRYLLIKSWYHNIIDLIIWLNDWLPERTKWAPSRRVRCAHGICRVGLARKSSLFAYIVNPQLAKLFWLKRLNIGLVLFCSFIISNSSRSTKNALN